VLGETFPVVPEKAHRHHAGSASAESTQIRVSRGPSPTEELQKLPARVCRQRPPLRHTRSSSVFGHEDERYLVFWGYPQRPAGDVRGRLAAPSSGVPRAGRQNNVTWLWTIKTLTFTGQDSVARWWPGRPYVTWVGCGGYSNGPQDNLHKRLRATIRQVRTFTRKPVLIDRPRPGPPRAAGICRAESLFAGVRRERGHMSGVVRTRTRNRDLKSGLGTLIAGTGAAAPFRGESRIGTGRAPVKLRAGRRHAAESRAATERPSHGDPRTAARQAYRAGSLQQFGIIAGGYEYRSLISSGGLRPGADARHHHGKSPIIARAGAAADGGVREQRPLRCPNAAITTSSGT